jgi:hypothetical protein
MDWRRYRQTDVQPTTTRGHKSQMTSSSDEQMVHNTRSKQGKTRKHTNTTPRSGSQPEADPASEMSLF